MKATTLDFQHLMNFMKEILKYFEIDSGNVRIGLLMYSSKQLVQFHLNSFQTKADIHRSISNVTFVQREPFVSKAFKIIIKKMLTLENGDRPDVDNIVIFLTDKISKRSMKKVLQKNRGTKATSYNLYASGFGINGLKQIAINTTIFKTKSTQHLGQNLPDIITSICPGELY